ncbi:manganese ABC transporter ATP-binding protein [Sinorhizobium meliloti]|uniref:Manganese ABC transporter ATP-binding protein n=1 Tax=Rhizobium meliloti TaxID=382 RepID=A0A2J0YU53_RHIML|nr:manganese ABC transporter ATP-binding protein [Sinorhizobium meliloti]
MSAIGPAVVFADVSLTLGGNEILKDISLRLEPGHIHGIVGPNGGGKSSLMLSLLGQMPHGGTIRLDGNPAPVIGYAPQSLDFDRTLPLTVSDVLAIMNQRRPAFLGHGVEPRQNWEAALDAVGLLELRNRLFGALSGGQRQRVLLAQAISPMPDLLIMDEPTSNMDRDATRRTEEIVTDLRSRGVTVLWVNHDWDQIRRAADTVTGINHTILFHGSPADVLAPLPAMESA